MNVINHIPTFKKGRLVYSFLYTFRLLCVRFLTEECFLVHFCTDNKTVAIYILCVYEFCNVIKLPPHSLSRASANRPFCSENKWNRHARKYALISNDCTLCVVKYSALFIVCWSHNVIIDRIVCVCACVLWHSHNPLCTYTPRDRSPPSTLRSEHIESIAYRYIRHIQPYTPFMKCAGSELVHHTRTRTLYFVYMAWRVLFANRRLHVDRRRFAPE